MRKICLIAGSAPTYREATFKMLEKDFGCHFILAKGPTKQMSIEQFSHVKQIQESKFVLKGLFTYKNLISLSRGYDVLILNIASNNILYYLFPIIAKCRGQKIISWTHGWYGKESSIRRLIKRIYFSMFDKILVYGHYAKELMIANGINRENLYEIHNSLDYNTQLALRNKSEQTDIYKRYFCNTDPVLLFIGRLRKVKKLDQILHAMSILKEKGKDYNLVLIGGGEDENTLKEEVKRLNLEDRVWFYGPCFDEVVNAELVYNADLCVAPGNIGLTSMHVLMFGCPALTHSNFAWQMPEFEAIHVYQTGLFFRMDDVEDLACKIEEWFKVNYNLRDHVRNCCYKEIDTMWNPNYQSMILAECINSIK